MNVPKRLSDVAFKEVWDRRCLVLYKANVGLRYHRKRQKHFDTLDKGTKAITMVLGVTVLGEVLKGWVPAAGGAITALGLFSLIFGYTDRKQAHKELAEGHAELAAKIEEATNTSLTDQQVSLWESGLSRLDAKAPPVLKTLMILCEHEQCVVLGKAEGFELPGWFKRLTSDWIDW